LFKIFAEIVNNLFFSGSFNRDNNNASQDCLGQSTLVICPLLVGGGCCPKPIHAAIVPGAVDLLKKASVSFHVVQFSAFGVREGGFVMRSGH